MAKTPRERLPDIHDYLTLLERVPETFKRSWDPIAVYDLEGRIMVGNAAARAIVGSDLAAALPGRHFTEHLTLNAATKAARDFALCATTGAIVESDTVFRDADNRPYPVRMRLVPALVDGAIVGVIGFARDGRVLRNIEDQFIRAEQQFRSLFENHPDALALHDLEGRFVRVNASTERLTGYTVDELIGQTPALLIAGGWADGKRTRAAIARGETVTYENTIATKGGDTREIEGLSVPLHVDGSVRGFCSITRDVTEERRRSRSAARQAARIAELYRIAAAANVASADKVAAALLVGMAELGASRAFAGHFNGGAIEIVHAAGTPATGRDELRLRDVRERNDAVVRTSFAGAPLIVEGKAYGAVGFARDAGPLQASKADREYVAALAALIASAIQQHEREKRLDTLAFGDALTGLPNRALLQDRLEQALLFARRHRRSFAAHYIDIDHFKEINDTYGHHVGDEVLIAVAAWLRTMLRDSDTIGRIGGDEFVVLQPEIESQRQAEELAARLCTIREHPFTIGVREIAVTISVGCAVFPVDAENPVDMLRAADTALYDVKHRGRNGYAVGVIA
jgi:diguanylate cyclase (GGDEF)-like protein/PAS domain S-box-containing protein